MHLQSPHLAFLTWQCRHIHIPSKIFSATWCLDNNPVNVLIGASINSWRVLILNCFLTSSDVVSNHSWEVCFINMVFQNNLFITLLLPQCTYSRGVRFCKWTPYCQTLFSSSLSWFTFSPGKFWCHFSHYIEKISMLRTPLPLFSFKYCLVEILFFNYCSCLSYRHNWT